MRQALIVLTLLSMISLPAAAQAALDNAEALTPNTEAAQAPEVAIEQSMPAVEQVENATEPIQQWLPSCWNYNGYYCSTPSTIVRCEWIPGEPGICVCSQNHVWNCG